MMERVSSLSLSLVPTSGDGVPTIDSEANPNQYHLKDRFGFFLSDEFHQSLKIPTELIKFRKEKESERTKKWLVMLKHWNRYFKHNKNAKLNQRVRKGIPDSLRGLCWQKLLDIDKVKEKIPDPYKIDVSTVSEITVDEIDRDVDRTFPRHVQFIETEGEGQKSLRRVLQWYAKLDPDVGYCQGMGFIAALFLTYMIETDAFYCFYATLQRPSAPLRLLYLPKLIEVQKILYVFGELGRQFLGALWEHLEKENMHPSMYFTEWIMTIFARGFSFDLVTRVWDIFLSEGSMKIIYRVSLAIIKNFEKELLSMRFDEIMGLFRHLPNRIDAAEIIKMAWTIPLKTIHITRLEEQYIQEHPSKDMTASNSSSKAGNGVNNGNEETL